MFFIPGTPSPNLFGEGVFIYTPGKVNLLVVDDETHIVRLIQVNLERLGHDVTIASSGNEALTLLDRHDFDRVVLDCSMPTPNGYDVLAHIRTTPRLSQIWVGIMCNEEETKDLLAMPHQADWYAGKPFDPNDLVE